MLTQAKQQHEIKIYLRFALYSALFPVSQCLVPYFTPLLSPHLLLYRYDNRHIILECLLCILLCLLVVGMIMYRIILGGPQDLQDYFWTSAPVPEDKGIQKYQSFLQRNKYATSFSSL